MKPLQEHREISGRCDTNRTNKEPPAQGPRVTISLDLLVSEEAGKILDVE